MWLLPPIALQILHCLDDADDALAFLTAAPNDSLDDALDALRTLLAMDLLLPLWPTAHIASLEAAYNVSPSVVTRVLPALKTITVACSQDCSSICHNTVLPPTTAVSAIVDLDATTVRAALGKWLPNLVDLKIVSLSSVNFAAIVKDTLSSCPRLCSLAMDQDEALTQDALDAALTAVVANCPQVAHISVEVFKLSYMSSCKSLLAWLALPTARHLGLLAIDFQDEPGADLAAAMLTSTTLETIELLETPSLARAVMSPLSPPLPRQLRHLSISDYTPDVDDVDPPRALDEADMATLAAKIAISHLESLDVSLEVSCDATSVLCAMPHIPSLTKFALEEATLTSFPPMMQLLHLELSCVTFSDEAIESLATLLCSSPKLVQLQLGRNQLPIAQASTIFCALPQWLSHRGTACSVDLAITSEACASAFATALAQTRNTHRVKLTVLAYGLSLAAKMLILAALASTARMAAVLLGSLNHTDDAALEAWGLQHHLMIVYRKEHPQSAKQTWFHSPRNTKTNY